ncbi:MAG: alpha/beta hydrolase [Prosthecobacter sp.]
MNIHRLPSALLTLCAGLLLLCNAHAKKAQAAKVTPDIANEHYGPHALNVLDLWKARSDKPTPLVVQIHGGGFHGGSKNTADPAMVAALTAKGISVMAISYRLSPEVTYPVHHMDCARAIQYARLRAREWNIDPARIGATGNSAGAGMILWLGFHDDLADPANADPVLRESSRLRGMAVFNAQTSYDPFVIKGWIGEATSKHPLFEMFYGLKPEQYDTPAARAQFAQASAVTHLTKDDPPVYAIYKEPRDPVPADAKPGAGIHHPNFGLRLKEQMDRTGIECTLRHVDEGADFIQEMTAFFVRHLLEGK